MRKAINLFLIFFPSLMFNQVENDLQHRVNYDFTFHVFDLSYANELLDLRRELQSQDYKSVFRQLKEMRSEILKADSLIIQNVDFFKYLESFSDHEELISNAERDKRYLLMDIEEIFDTSEGDIRDIAHIINDLYFNWRNPLFKSEWFYCPRLYFSSEFLNFIKANAPTTWLTLNEAGILPPEDFMFYQGRVAEGLEEPNDFDFYHLTKEISEIMKEELILLPISDDDSLNAQMQLLKRILEGASTEKFHVTLKRSY